MNRRKLVKEPRQLELGELAGNIKCTNVEQRAAESKSPLRCVKSRVPQQLDTPTRRLVNR